MWVIQKSDFFWTVSNILSETVPDHEKGKQSLESLLGWYYCTGPGATEKWFCAPVIGDGGKLAKAHQQNYSKEVIHLLSVRLNPCTTLVTKIRCLENVLLGIRICKAC